MSEQERTTRSDIPLKPVYTPEDLTDMAYERDLADPGQYPFTRGLYPTGYRRYTWKKQEVSGFGLPEETNARQKYLMQHGQEAYGGLPTINIAFDLPTQYGYDSDDPRFIGDVGICGTLIDTIDDMERLFEGLPLDKTNPSFIIEAPSPILMAMYIAVAESHGVHRSQLTGNICNDPLHCFICNHMEVLPPRESLRVMVDLIEFCTKEMPLFNPVNLNGHDVREAACTAVQEVAFTLALARDLVRACLAKGMALDQFAPRFSFHFSVDNYFFEEICKLRAARRMWARIMREQFGAQNPKSWMARIYMQCGGSTLARQEPLNNIARTAFQALAAVLGGTQGLHTNSYDEVYCIPTDEAVRVAVKTQKIIEHETGVCDVVDPLGGSYYVEWLTNKIEQEAQAYLDKIDGMGGYIAAIENGYMVREIANASMRHQRKVETGERVIVGVNKYVSDPGEPICLFSYNPRLQEIARERLEENRRTRDNAAVQAAISSLREACRREEPLMPVLIDAVKTGASLGELMGVFREVHGEYTEKPVLATSAQGC